MSKYKVGDKVLLEMVIDDVDEINDDFWVSLEREDTEEGMWLKEEQIDKYAYKGAFKTYEDGLADAWKLARKIFAMKDKEFDDVFGYAEFSDAVYYNTPQEALAKIEAYEKSQQIQGGDVVYANGVQGVVIDIISDDDCYIYDENGCIEVVKFEKINKTGRTVDIEHLLEQIRGDE